MNSSKFLHETNPNRKILEAVDLANRTIDSSQGINKSRLLLITLSTTVMTALKKPLPKEYYQWTRGYLDTIRNEDGTSLSNISKFLKHIDWFEKNNNIEDELQNSRVVLPPDEEIEINVFEAEEDVTPIPEHSMLSSTKVPQETASKEKESVSKEKVQKEEVKKVMEDLPTKVSDADGDD